MPRANRHFLPGQIWHITHRCHRSEFLLKFVRDRERYLHWLFESRKRFGLCVLNYMVTRNHVHLLLKDTEAGTIASGIQLAAGRTGQEFNDRKKRKGAFWEDRYHATAVSSDQHLHRCITYIDLNMVRAGVGKHPAEWDHCGYREIQDPPDRYSIIDLEALRISCGFSSLDELRARQQYWVNDAIKQKQLERDARWTQAIAVGNPEFVTGIREQLGPKAAHRVVSESGPTHVLRENKTDYEVSSFQDANTFDWQQLPSVI